MVEGKERSVAGEESMVAREEEVLQDAVAEVAEVVVDAKGVVEGVVDSALETTMATTTVGAAARMVSSVEEIKVEGTVETEGAEKMVAEADTEGEAEARHMALEVGRDE